jgi:hypothetical protein
MDQATLVNLDVDAGIKVLNALDAANLKITVALWLASSDYSDWRLILSSPALDQTHPLKAYEQVAEVLHEQSVQVHPPILILPTKDAFIRYLHRMFGKSKDTNGMRLGGQTIGNRFISDAYVYRVQ